MNSDDQIHQLPPPDNAGGGAGRNPLYSILQVLPRVAPLGLERDPHDLGKGSWPGPPVKLMTRCAGKVECVWDATIFPRHSIWPNSSLSTRISSWKYSMMSRSSLLVEKDWMKRNRRFTTSENEHKRTSSVPTNARVQGKNFRRPLPHWRGHLLERFGGNRSLGQSG